MTSSGKSRQRNRSRRSRNEGRQRQRRRQRNDGILGIRWERQRERNLSLLLLPSDLLDIFCKQRKTLRDFALFLNYQLVEILQSLLLSLFDNRKCPHGQGTIYNCVHFRGEHNLTFISVNIPSSKSGLDFAFSHWKNIALSYCNTTASIWRTSESFRIVTLKYT